MVGSAALNEWKKARFGLMVHFGLYSIPGGLWKGQEAEYVGEWLQARFRIPKAEYEKLADRFDPRAFDADEWVLMARAAGMRYLVVTAKHHDGFALFHSRADRFNSVDAAPFGRDIIAELSAACARHGLKLALYYSQTLDWREPNAGGTNAKGLNYGMSWFNNWDFPEEGRKFSEYFERKALPQITELLTDYGPIMALWFDTPLDMDRSFSRRIFERVKELQPDCLINSRLGCPGCDYETTGDNMIPPGKSRFPSEAPATLNDTWGFKHHDHNWKSSRQIIRTLTALASHDVNYLLNIGPDGSGAFPAEARKVLDEVGVWMRGNGGSVFGAEPCPFDAEPGWASVTTRDKHLYLRLEPDAEGSVSLGGLRSRCLSARLLADRSVRIPFVQNGEVLSLDLPSACGLQVVDAETDGSVEVRPGLFPHGGRLQLDAAQGIFAGVPDRPETAQTSTIDADGESFDDSVPSIRRGTTFGWKTSGVRMEWPVWFEEAGTYRASVESSVAYHGQPWSGGHRLRVRIGTGETAGVLSLPPNLSDDHSVPYRTVVSDLGTIAVPARGGATVSLDVAEWRPCPTGLHLTRLVLVQA